MKTPTTRLRSSILSGAFNFLVTVVSSHGQIAPQITPTTGIQHRTVFAGRPISFTVTALGTAPLSYQWRWNGQDLPGRTNQTLQLSSAAPTNEGDYSVVVSNALGVATNHLSARLFVATTNRDIKANFTNQAGLRLPYFYKLPRAYDPLRQYPFIFTLHGTPTDENALANDLANIPGTHTFHSFAAVLTAEGDAGFLRISSR